MIASHSGTFRRFRGSLTLKSAPRFAMDRRIYRARESWTGRACERLSRARTCHWLTRRRFVPLLPSLSNRGAAGRHAGGPSSMQVGRPLASSSRAYPSDGDARLTAALTVVRRDVALRAPDGLDRRLAWFVDSTVRLSLPRIPSPITASVASMPSRSELAAPGCVWSSSSARRWSCSSARWWSVSAHARRAQLVPAGAPTPVFRTNSLPTPELTGISR